MAQAPEATGEFANFHLTLEDDSTKLGLVLCNSKGSPDPNSIRLLPSSKTAFQISAGQTEYSDHKPPYFSIPQLTFAKGRGNEDFENDTSRFFDSKQVDTIKGDIILAPLDHETTGYYNDESSGDRDGQETIAAGGSTVRYASPITAAETFTLRKVKVDLRFTDTNEHTVTVRVYDDSGGDPNTLLTGATRYITPEEANQWETYEFDVLYDSWTAAAVYHISVEVTGTETFDIGTTTDITSLKSKTDAGAWTSISTEKGIAFSVYDHGKGRCFLFEYKGQLYMVTKPDDNTAPRMYMNGYRGCAADNSADMSLLKSGLSLTEDELDGCVAKITAGKGLSEQITYRDITGNTVGGDVSCYPDWKVTHDTTTEFVILGCNTWIECQGSYSTVLKYPVTDVQVINDIVYIAQGEHETDSYIIIYNAYNNSGTWTQQSKADAQKATFLEYHVDDDELYRFVNISTPEAYTATPLSAYSGSLTWGSAISVGSSDSKINNAGLYGNPLDIWLIKEDSFGNIVDDAYSEIPIAEMRNVKSIFNGMAMMAHNVNLYFSLLDGLEQYYDVQLRDMGANTDAGLPAGRAGYHVHLLGYPGRFYAAIDAGSSGYSSVLCNNGYGWHEIYRAPYGKSVRHLHVQTIPGILDRLWVSIDEDLIWLPIAIHPLHESNYEYISEGELITSWIYGNYKDVIKYFNSLTIFGEDFSENQKVTLYYQTDNEDQTDTWNQATAEVTTSPKQKVKLSNDSDVSGHRIRFKLKLSTTSSTSTPRIKVIVLNGIIRLPVGDTFSITFLVQSADLDAKNKETGLKAEDLFDQLRTWADAEQSPLPLTMKSNFSMFSDQSVFVDPMSLQPFRTVSKEGAQAHSLIGSLKLIVASED